jgi:2'-5' RNA ligase
MRLFVALEIPEAVRDNLASLRRNFPESPSTVRWVRPENFHVTLKFIGSVPTEKVQALIEALRGVSLHGRLNGCFRGLGWFLDAKTGVILLAIIEDSKPLAALAASIDHRLLALGIAPENRSFMPHLTLARGNRSVPDSSKIALRELADKYKKHDFGCVTPEEFHLTESKTLPTGPIYSKVQSFPLVAAGN